MSNFLFTSESVSEGHPDKVADQISDAVLDAILEQDPTGRVAAETLVSTGLVVMAGEITTKANVDYARVARETVRAIGYNDPELRFDADGCAVMVCYGRQSPDIAQGVDQRVRRLPEPGRRRPGPDVRLRVRRDAVADAVPHLLRAPAGAAAKRSAPRRPPAVPAARREVAGDRALRRRQAGRGGHGGAVHAASSVDERQAEQARRSGDRGDHQAGVPGEHAEGHALPRESDRPLRDRRAARRCRADRAARSSSTRTAARRRTAAARSPARTRRRSTARPRMRRATSRRTSSPRASRGSARCRSPTRSASPSR